MFLAKFGFCFMPDYREMEFLGLPTGRGDYLSIAPTLKGPFTSEY